MLKRILLLLGETPSSISARKYGLRLAKKYDAELVGFAGVDQSYIEVAMPGTIGAASYRIMLQEELKAQAHSVVQNLREIFVAECRNQDVAFQFLSFGEGDPTEAVQMAMEAHDLVVTGHDTAFRGKEHEALSEILANLLALCSRPLIVCPDEYTDNEEVLVAYDASIPAMRAVQLYALLKMSDDVCPKVLSVDPSQVRASRLANGAADYLRIHGYQVEAVPIATYVDEAEVLRIEVAHRKVGLMVMGAYGHRGLREYFFGSTTSGFVKNPPCPLFLYH